MLFIQNTYTSYLIEQSDQQGHRHHDLNTANGYGGHALFYITDPLKDASDHPIIIQEEVQWNLTPLLYLVQG